VRKEVREYLKTRLLEILPDKDEEVRQRILYDVVAYAWEDGWVEGRDQFEANHSCRPEEEYGW
jgi:hypothetical protein